MFNLSEINIKILSVHKLSWSVQNKYAFPRPHHALSLRIKGEAEFIHNKTSYKVKEKDIIFVPKNYDYTLISKREERVIVIHFDCDREFEQMQVFSSTDNEVFHSLFSLLIETFDSNHAGCKHKAYSLFYQILEQIQMQSSLRSSSRVSDSFENANSYLKSNFSDGSLTVEKLAKIASVSPTYYRKMFAKIYNTSPNKYLNDLRLTQANTLLKTGYYTVEETAFQCGYNDSKYFATCYKKKYGHPPGKDIPRLFKNI
jgi:AraC-like DNA-binding protein